MASNSNREATAHADKSTHALDNSQTNPENNATCEVSTRTVRSLKPTPTHPAPTNPTDKRPITPQKPHP